MQKINIAREKNNEEPISLDDHSAARMAQAKWDTDAFYLDEEMERELAGRGSTDTIIVEEDEEEKDSRSQSMSSQYSAENQPESRSSSF